MVGKERERRKGGEGVGLLGEKRARGWRDGGSGWVWRRGGDLHEVRTSHWPMPAELVECHLGFNEIDSIHREMRLVKG